MNDDEEKIQYWNDRPAGVSGGVGNNFLSEQYVQRRQERTIGLAVYGTLIDLQNFMTFVDVYSWRGEDKEIVDGMRKVAKECYDAMKSVEVALLSISDVFYAPIIPTESGHKVGNENG